MINLLSFTSSLPVQAPGVPPRVRAPTRRVLSLAPLGRIVAAPPELKCRVVCRMESAVKLPFLSTLAEPLPLIAAVDADPPGTVNAPLLVTAPEVHCPPALTFTLPAGQRVTLWLIRALPPE